MTTETTPQLLTADDLLELYSQGVRGELIRGVLCETMSTGVNHGQIVVEFASEIRAFVKPRRLGRVVGSDTGIRIERDPDTVREPDIAYFSAERMPLDQQVSGYAEVAPELVVEVKSPNDSRQTVYDKAEMWLRYGVRLAWAVYPERRTVEAHHVDRGVVVYQADDELDGMDVLPGFTCAVGPLFEV